METEPSKRRIIVSGTKLLDLLDNIDQTRQSDREEKFYRYLGHGPDTPPAGDRETLSPLPQSGAGGAELPLPDAENLA